MVRDGRASVHSMISRKVTIAGFDLNSYRDCLTKWNRAIETMYNQCMEVGYKKCMLVHYEQLVLHPERWMRTVLKFLQIPWNHSVLHHEEMIGKAGEYLCQKWRDLQTKSSSQSMWELYQNGLGRYLQMFYKTWQWLHPCLPNLDMTHMPIHLTMENLIPKSLKTPEGSIKENFSFLNFLKKNLSLSRWSSRARNLLHTWGKTAAFLATEKFLGLAVPCWNEWSVCSMPTSPAYLLVSFPERVGCQHTLGPSWVTCFPCTALSILITCTALRRRNPAGMCAFC